MIVVDIRNFFTVRNVELIEVNNDFIYYAEEKNEEGHNNLFLLEYNRVTRRERIVANYSLDDPTFVQHIFSFTDCIVLLLENGGNTVWVFRVDKNTGAETARTQINCIGTFADCIALDKRHILLYTVSSESCASIFKEYKKVTGCTRIAYLHDIDEEKKYFVKDTKLCQLLGEDVKLFNTKEGRQVLLLDPYGDEELKERCYRDARWINGNVCDNMWQSPLTKLLANIKAGEEKVEMQRIVTAGIEGMARYTGMDNEFIYFKVKSFSSQEECVCSCEKTGGKIKVLARLEPCAENTYNHIDTSVAKIYRIEEQDETYTVTGVVNSSVHAEYEKKLGVFVGCVEDRFVITRKVMNDAQGQYDFEYNCIYDVKMKTEESFECKCVIRGNTLVLY